MEKSILAGCSLVSACLVAQLVYSVIRDHRELERSGKEQAEQARVLAEQFKRTQSKAAWDRSVKFLDSELRDWLARETKDAKDRVDVHLDLVMVKIFELSDVIWN